MLHLWHPLLPAGGIIESEHLVAPVAMERQNRHAITRERQASVLPRTLGLRTLPRTPGQETSCLHIEMQAMAGLIDKKQARSCLAVILCGIDADCPLCTLNWH